MSEEVGPIYGVRLIRDLSLPGGMRQAMPSHADLSRAEAKGHTRLVAGYEVLLAHYLEADKQRRAVQAVEKWGIHAVPCGERHPPNMWKARMPNGNDGPLEWMIATGGGPYATWEDAILGLAQWYESNHERGKA